MVEIAFKNSSTARLENTGDIAAHWRGKVWETTETLLNFNSRDLWRIWYGGRGVERHLGAVIYLCNFHSDLVPYDLNLGASFTARSRVHRSEREAEMLFSSPHRGPFRGRVVRRNSCMSCCYSG